MPSLTTSYPWLVLVFAVRGLGAGLVLQPLTVAALSKVSPNQYTQASSLNTVVRFVFTSLGIAVLATFVQSRASIHVSALASQVRTISPALRQQGLDLAVQDAFWLSLAAFALAFLVVCFLRVPKPAPPKAVPQEQEENNATARLVVAE